MHAPTMRMAKISPCFYRFWNQGGLGAGLVVGLFFFGGGCARHDAPESSAPPPQPVSVTQPAGEAPAPPPETLNAEQAAEAANPRRARTGAARRQTPTEEQSEAARLRAEAEAAVAQARSPEPAYNEPDHSPRPQRDGASEAEAAGNQAEMNARLAQLQAEEARAMAYARELQMQQARQEAAKAMAAPPKPSPSEPPSEPATSALPPNVPEDPLSPLDAALQQMKTGTLAFNTPREMALLEPTLIHLVLSPLPNDASVAALVRGPGPVSVERARYASTVEARLTGDGFLIDAITATSQPVSQLEPTEWRWQATPRAPGQRALFVSIYAVVTLDGERHERLIKTFEREFVVRVTFWRHPWMYLRYRPQAGLIGLGLLAGLGAGLVVYMRGYRSMKATGSRFSITRRITAVEVFISYSSKDRAWVEQFTSGLRAAGRTVWMDVGGIAPAMQWSTQIVEALSRSKMVVFVGSKNSLRSHNVAKEISLASEQQKIILPLLIDDGAIPPELLYPLAGLQVTRLHNPSDIAEAVRTVLAVLDHVKPGKK